MSRLTKLHTGLLAAVLAAVFATNAAAQTSDTDGSLALTPSNATAFVHFNLREMVQTPGMELPIEIIDGVKKELDELVEGQLGIRITELKDATYVMPTFASLVAIQSNDSFVGFGLIAFTQPVNEESIADHLPGTWKPSRIGKTYVFMESATKHVMFRCSTNTIAIGSQDAIEWFLENRDSPANDVSRPLIKAAKSNHITFGINGDEIPSEIRMYAPPEAKPFVKAKACALSLDFKQGIAFRAVMDFKSEKDAAIATAAIGQNIADARAALKQEEGTSFRTFHSKIANVDEAWEPLSRLAIIRYGDKLLKEARIAQTKKRLDAEIEIKGLNGNLAVLTCLAAIQAIGSASDAEFERISQELNR